MDLPNSGVGDLMTTGINGKPLCKIKILCYLNIDMSLAEQIMTSAKFRIWFKRFNP